MYIFFLPAFFYIWWVSSFQTHFKHAEKSTHCYLCVAVDNFPYCRIGDLTLDVSLLLSFLAFSVLRFRSIEVFGYLVFLKESWFHQVYKTAAERCLQMSTENDGRFCFSVLFTSRLATSTLTGGALPASIVCIQRCCGTFWKQMKPHYASFISELIKLLFFNTFMFSLAVDVTDHVHLVPVWNGGHSWQWDSYISANILAKRGDCATFLGGMMASLHKRKTPSNKLDTTDHLPP